MPFDLTCLAPPPPRRRPVYKAITRTEFQPFPSNNGKQDVTNQPKNICFPSSIAHLQPKLNFHRNSSELRFRAPTSYPGQFLIRFHNHNFKNFNFQFAAIPKPHLVVLSRPRRPWMAMMLRWRLWCNARRLLPVVVHPCHESKCNFARVRGVHFRCSRGAFFIDDDDDGFPCRRRRGVNEFIAPCPLEKA